MHKQNKRINMQSVPFLFFFFTKVVGIVTLITGSASNSKLEVDVVAAATLQSTKCVSKDVFIEARRVACTSVDA